MKKVTSIIELVKTQRQLQETVQIQRQKTDKIVKSKQISEKVQQNMQSLIDQQFNTLNQLDQQAKQAAVAGSRGDAATLNFIYEKSNQIWIKFCENNQKIEQSSEINTAMSEEYKKKQVWTQGVNKFCEILETIGENSQKILQEDDKQFIREVRKTTKNQPSTSSVAVLSSPVADMKQNKKPKNPFSDSEADEKSKSDWEELQNLFERNSIQEHDNKSPEMSKNTGNGSSKQQTSPEDPSDPVGSSDDDGDDKRDDDRKRREDQKNKKKEEKEPSSEEDELDESTHPLKLFQVELKHMTRAMARTISDAIKISSSNAHQPSTQPDEEYSAFRRVPVEFPNFDGNMLNYASFKTNFFRLAEETKMSKTQQYIMLRSVLDYEVLRTIAAIEDVPDNYELIWKKLDERYYNRRLILAHIIDGLESAPPTVSGDSKTFIELANRVFAFEVNKRYLQFEHNEFSNALVADIVFDKLSETCQSRLSDRVKDKTQVYTLEIITEFLESEAIHWDQSHRR